MSNRDIVSAVVLKWVEPLLSTMAASKLASIPLLANVESKIKSTGWVGQGWTIGNDLAPYMTCIASSLVQPMVSDFLANIPDAAIPQMFHGVVDTAIQQGQMELLGGNIVFDTNDLHRLKRLLNANLPIVEPIKLEEDEKC